MRCSEARRALLEADLYVLRGEGPTPLAIHIRRCPECRARADALLGGEYALGEALAGAVPAPDPDTIIRLAREEEAALPSRLDVSPPSPPRGWRPTGLGPGAALWSLAAAAALSALFFFGTDRTPSLPGNQIVLEPEPRGLNVEVPKNQRVAVLQTGNPDISVLWLF